VVLCLGNRRLLSVRGFRGAAAIIVNMLMFAFANEGNLAINEDIDIFETSFVPNCMLARET
jgi:hypothetical protein